MEERTYIVQAQCRPRGRTRRPGEEVELTEREARYLVLNGQLAPKAKKGR